MAVSILRHRFTSDDYHRMAACGILGADDRVELLDGEIVEMTPIGRRHAACVDRLTDLLAPRLHGRVIVRVQNPISLDTHSEPQPDVSLLRYRGDFYESGHPAPQDVLLVIEVADTTADLDVEVKLPLYARAGIAEVWVVNLPEERLEVYQSPDGPGYRDTRHLLRSDAVTPGAFPDLTIQVASILG